jgi:hypothetical protein
MQLLHSEKKETHEIISFSKNQTGYSTENKNNITELISEMNALNFQLSNSKSKIDSLKLYVKPSFYVNSRDSSYLIMILTDGNVNTIAIGRSEFRKSISEYYQIGNK